MKRERNTLLWTILLGVAIICACLAAGNAVAMTTLQDRVCPSSHNWTCPPTLCFKPGKDFGGGPILTDMRWENEGRIQCSVYTCQTCTLMDAGCQFTAYSTQDGSCGDVGVPGSINWFNICGW